MVKIPMLSGQLLKIIDKIRVSQSKFKISQDKEQNLGIAVPPMLTAY
jgi:hypothetical protein